MPLKEYYITELSQLKNKTSKNHVYTESMNEMYEAQNDTFKVQNVTL